LAARVNSLASIIGSQQVSSPPLKNISGPFLKKGKKKMGIGIDWGVLFAPLIIKLVEALVDAILRWIATLPAAQAVEKTACVIDLVALFYQGDRTMTDVATLNESLRKVKTEA